ncbi:MAG: hypothetical protein JST47_11935 [Bacteroidetes bacterium]|nr:hypothetical protein [Bacteroidota bacterium]
MVKHLLYLNTLAIKQNIDPRASFFVIFVLLTYITLYDRLVKTREKDRT